MGVNAGMPVYHSVAKVSLCSTDRLHYTDEHKNISSTGRRHNERVVRWNNIVRNLASCEAGRMILMDLEHELRALDQARFTTDDMQFDSIEGQGWMNRVFQERLDELEVELFDTGALRTVEATNVPRLQPLCPQNWRHARG